MVILLSPGVAADFKIEPIGQPVVKFDGDPRDDKRRVRLDYTVHYDGRITDVEVMSSTNEAYGLAAKRAVSEWRFKPWARDGNPEAVRLSVILGRGEAGGLRGNFKQNVMGLKCQTLNDEIDELKAKSADFNLSQLNVYVESQVVLDLLPNPGRNTIAFQEAQGWRAYFNGIFPGVIKGCRNNPASLYIDQLPELMKRRLP